LGAKLPAKAGRVSVTVTYTGKTFTLCSLTPEKCEQQPLDITFMEGEEVTFATQGADCVVDLTGNYVMDLDDGPEDDEYDSDDMMQLMGPDGMFLNFERIQYVILIRVHRHGRR
jgi:FK506-binding nuclear protein